MGDDIERLVQRAQRAMYGIGNSFGTVLDSVSALDALRARAEAAEARAEAAEAKLAAARAEAQADERGQVVAWCNAVGHHGARDAIAAGLHWSRD